MSHDHHHHHHHHHHHNHQNKKVLLFAFILTILFAILEVTYGILTSSLSLLSEGIHMSSDGLSLFIAFFAVWLATKKPNNKKTFGYHRAEPIAAFLNGLGLLIIPILVMIESIRRLIQGSNEILSKEMFFVAIIGLIINLIVAFTLSRGEKDNLNVRAAMLHIIADLISSVSTIIVSLLIMFFDLVFIDAIVSFVISIIIFSGGLKVTKESFNILMESTPDDFDVEKIKNELLSINGLEEIKELRIWSLKSEQVYINIHIKISENSNHSQIIKDIKENTIVKELHETIQIVQ